MEVRIKDREENIEFTRMALVLCGVNVDYETTEFVLDIIEKQKELGGEFSIRDAAKLTTAHHEKWTEYRNNLLTEKEKERADLFIIDEARREYEKGHKIESIKILKGHFGWKLSECKDYVEQHFTLDMFDDAQSEEE